MTFSCNISLGAIHSHTFLVGQLKCDPRPATFYAWQQSWQLQDLFSCITALCNYTKKTRENKPSDSRTRIQVSLNSGKPHRGLPEVRCRLII